MSDFDQLVASRQEWIQTVLVPWCRVASLKHLQRAEREWGDIAGKVDPQATLWVWAWERFPGFIVEGLRGFDETFAVTITLQDGEQQTGFPDARKSQGGALVLVAESGDADLGPFSIDEIANVERVAP